MSFRTLFAGWMFAPLVLAGPPLTTIQDVLYKADGTRFNGTLTITWNTFQAMDNSTIVTQTTTVKVVDGNLRVQLVPTTTGTPANYYNVVYSSDGHIQFQENWSVPSSGQPLRVQDVRVAGTSQSGSSGSDTAGDDTAIQESDVTGLVADLSARVIKGPAYAAGRVAFVNSSGAIDSVTGSDSDCVRVDGTSGPCGRQQTSFADGEIPAGVVDGANTMFSLAAVPDPVSSLALYRNGLLQKSGFDFNLTGSTIQFVAGAVPQPGDTLLASYRQSSGSDDGVGSMYSAAQVLCAGVGAATASTTLSNLGACTIPAGVLIPGDRVEIHFDLEHAGSTGGFRFEVHWGATTVLQRDASAGDSLATGRVEAAIKAAGAQLSAQSWGAVLPVSASVTSSPDAWTGGLTINLLGNVVQAGETLSLQNFSVVRLP